MNWAILAWSSLTEMTCNSLKRIFPVLLQESDDLTFKNELGQFVFGTLTKK